MRNGTQKRGLNPDTKIAIGCGVLLMLAGIAAMLILGWGLSKAMEIAEEEQKNPYRAEARITVRMHPDLQLVSSDAEAGTITFRHRPSGNEATMTYQEIAEGKWQETAGAGEPGVGDGDTGAGESAPGEPGGETPDAGELLDRVPEWLPLYPDADEILSSFIGQTKDGISGTVNLTTGDSGQEVIGYYATWFGENGYRVSNRTGYANGATWFASIIGESAEGGRSVTVGTVQEEGQTQMTISFSAGPV